MFPDDADYDDRDVRLVATALIEAEGLEVGDRRRALDLVADLATARGVRPAELPLLDLECRHYRA